MKTIQLLTGFFLLLLLPSCEREARTIDAAFLEQIVVLADDVEKLKLKGETCYVYLKKNRLTKPEHQQALNGARGPHYEFNLSNQNNDLATILETYQVHYSKSLPVQYHLMDTARSIQLSAFEFIIVGWILNLILLIAALVTILKNEFSDANNKIIWVVLVLFAPFIGSILFFIIGRSQIKRSRNV